MNTYKDEILIHYGVPGMKWGHRKQRVSKPMSKRRQRKANYKLVSRRLKEKGINSMQLQDYERGGVSAKNVRKYLGNDISTSQVSDYVKQKQKNGRKAVYAYLGGLAAATLTYGAIVGRK